MWMVALLATQLAAGQSSLDVGTQPNELIDNLQSNNACVFCHSSAQEDRMPVTAYRGTMMNLAGVDPVFLAATEITYARDQALTEVCIRCHYPKAWLEGRGLGTPSNDYGLNAGDYEGITCDFCHRAVAPEPVDPNSVVPPPELSGVVIENSQVYLAAYDNVKQGPNGSTLTNGHASTESALIKDSVMCAHCHDVSNDFLTLKNADGSDTGQLMPFERTYTEWKDSAFSDPADPDAASCQDCHFERWDGYTATAGPPPYRQDLGLHTMVGGNHVVPKMVAEIYRDDPDAPGFLQDLDADADRVVEATIRNLQDNAAELTTRELVVDENGARLKVRVENKAGHKLPTGYSEGRRMWLGHVVRDSNNSEQARSGTPDNTTWDIAEPPAQKWEVALSEDQLTHSFHLATVDKVLKDNRIPPKGFRPQLSTQPVGYEFEVLENGTLAHWDDVELDLGQGDCWPVVVEATLYFQTLSGDYYRFLLENAPLNRDTLQASWEAVGGAVPVEMQEIQVTVFPDGTIQNGAAPGACQPAPVFQEPEPEPAPEVGPEEPEQPTPEPNVAPGPEVPTVNDPWACVCTAPSAGTPSVALLLVGLLAVLRRRRQP